MRIPFLFIFIFSMSICSTCWAQKLKTVRGEYTYVLPETMSIEEGKRIALERAQISALANEFGTIISQESATIVDAGSDLRFHLYSSSDVKGDWIQTIGEPTFQVEADGRYICVKVTVEGKAREIISSSVELQALTLRNGVGDNLVSTDFKDGDNLYMSLKVARKGFVAIYLIDDDEAFCLLPYKAQEEVLEIQANKKYVLFSQEQSLPSMARFTDEYTLTCDEGVTYNDIYVLYSPQRFVPAMTDEDVSEKLPRQLTRKAFDQWLSKNRKMDKNMICKKIIVKITK